MRTGSVVNPPKEIKMAGLVVLPARQRVTPRGLARNLNGLTHDLRNVMASLELCAEVIGQPGVLTPGNEYLAGEVRSVANAAMGLMRQVEQARGGRSAMTAAWNARNEGTGTEVAQVLTSLDRMLRRTAGPAVRLEVESAPCWGRMAISANDLGRVLMNLVRNASEAMPNGGRIRVTAQMAGGQSFAVSGQPMQAASAVLICVQDNGPGVPLDLGEQIFEPGFTTKRAVDEAADELIGSGHGLGLAVARELVEMAGGSLKLASSARGARFEMELPLTNVMRSWASQTQFDGQGGRA